MLHINLDTCTSTQSYLKELIETDSLAISKDILVTTTNQTNGRGRGDHLWTHFEDSLAMSCLLSATEPITNIPLKVGLLCAKFFAQNYGKKILLKWPNDLLNENNSKIGGILCQLVQNKIIVGIGLNLHRPKKIPNENFNFDFLFDDQKIIQNNLAKELYKFLLENIDQKFNPLEWGQNCSHLNKKVKIQDEFSTNQGIFKGVEISGEAILTINQETKKIISGSLFLI